MKKFFVIAALAASMSVVSCGGDKGNGADSDSVANQAAVEAVTGNPEADALVAKINACTSVEELQAVIADNQAAFAALPADAQAKVEEITSQKGNSLVAALQEGATEVVEQVTEVTEVPAAAGDAVEAAKAAGENVVEKAKAAGEAAVEKAKAAGEDAVAKAKAVGEDAAAKAKAAAKGLGL